MTWGWGIFVQKSNSPLLSPTKIRDSPRREQDRSKEGGRASKQVLPHASPSRNRDPPRRRSIDRSIDSTTMIRRTTTTSMPHDFETNVVRISAHKNPQKQRKPNPIPSRRSSSYWDLGGRYQDEYDARLDMLPEVGIADTVSSLMLARMDICEALLDVSGRVGVW